MASSTTIGGHDEDVCSRYAARRYAGTERAVDLVVHADMIGVGVRVA